MKAQASLLLCVFIGGCLGAYYGGDVGGLVTKEYDVKGHVYWVDSKRILIRGFTYNGGGPDAYFWVETATSTPSAQGISVPDENGSASPLGAYSGTDVLLTLPDGVTTANVKVVSIWCKQYAVDFGSVVVPSDVAVPAEKNLGPLPQTSPLNHGVKSDDVLLKDDRTIFIKQLFYDGTGPDAFFIVGTGNVSSTGYVKIPDENGSLNKLASYNGKDVTIKLPDGVSLRDVTYFAIYCIQAHANFGHINFNPNLNLIPALNMDQMTPVSNCEKLHDHFSLGWEVMGEDIILEFKVALDDFGYASFGLSGATDSSAMVGGSVVVVYLDVGTPVAEDITMSSKSQCSQGRGVCASSDQQVTVVSARTVDGISTIRVKRPRKIDGIEYKTAGEQYVIWAMGRFNDLKMVTKHDLRLIGDMKLAFGRASSKKCTAVKPRDGKQVTPWAASRISGKDTTIFKATLGPTGGPKGYQSITGQQSWGIAWYMNDLLIPELVVKRGETYTFVVQGGRNPDTPAKYHPLYITDDRIGGYAQKTAQQRKEVKVFAGVNMTTGKLTGEAVGDLCEYAVGNSSPESHSSFLSYRSTLSMHCAGNGSYGNLTWTPDVATPDIVYYQCFTHNYLGWKIYVTDDYIINGSGRQSITWSLIMGGIITMATVTTWQR